jgi:hypothetical protein
MLDINALFEFSRTYCIPICAVLVPVNLLATLQTMLMAGFSRPAWQVQLMATVAILYAGLLILHVLTWWAVGIVMAPTYILSILGSLCIGTNLVAVLYSNRRMQLIDLRHLLPGQ